MARIKRVGADGVTLIDDVSVKRADNVAGKVPGNGADNILLLDGTGKVPLANIPTTLTGKDADTVDNCHAGVNANNVLKLDGNGLVPLANIPTTLTGKNADMVDNYHAGNGANQLLILDSSGKVPMANIPLSSIVPTGVILMWSGSTAAIPSGWALCNGTNGTPDLRDRFIVGAGNSYSVGATGGSASATTNVSFSSSGTYDIGGSYASAGHTHTVSTLPPYYALAYIMKL